MILPEFARLQLLAVAESVMRSRPPDVKINETYVHRWMVYPKNRWRNIYIHKFMKSDDDRALHNHEPDNFSIILQNPYIEHFLCKPRVTVDGKFLTYSEMRLPGQIIGRLAGTFHRVELVDDQPVITMFVQGIRRRHWEFACESGTVPWETYIGEGGCK